MLAVGFRIKIDGQEERTLADSGIRNKLSILSTDWSLLRPLVRRTSPVRA
jgi:hypothetical protein